jgi:lipoprotein-releasing system ATP-binding protein
MKLLQDLGMDMYASRMPATLSGGEQQRVAIARGLLGNPNFLLIDEPTAPLDIQSKQHMITLLHVLRDQYKIGMLVATHDPDVAQHADETGELHNGTLVHVTR